MDSSWFDDLTKALATATSRRQALKTIVATTLGSILGLGGLDTALADNSACAHFCASVFGADTPAAGQCTSDAAHHKGLCYTCGPASPGGTQPLCCPKNANGYCSSYSSATCCSGGQICQNAQCMCPSGETECNGACVNLNTNHSNCGSCGHACRSDETCQNGACICTSGGEECNGTCCSGNTPNCCSNTCTNIQTDASNCGTCGHTCPANETCVSGACTCGSSGDCTGGKSCCNGMCVNEQTDLNNCGSCGHTCRADQICSGGTCVCPSGQTDCNGMCVNEQTDPNNCGACGHVCQAGSICQNGTCVGVCDTLCNGTLVSEWPGHNHCCQSTAFDIDGHEYCSPEEGNDIKQNCASDCDCPKGYYCNFNGTACIPAACCS